MICRRTNSSDNSESQFNEYYAQMPWLAIPYEERDTKEALSREFGVRGIPMLVVIDENGELITKEGRGNVTSDPTGANFPWRPRPIRDVLSDGPLMTKSGTADASVLAGKYIGVYFSAHWCPPCRAFTPVLAAMYNKRKSSGQDDFEVVFVSADNSQREYDDYFGEMPWLALPYGDPRCDTLAQQQGIQGYPTLLIVSPEGEVVNSDGTSAVRADPEGAKFPYLPQPIEDLGSTINSYGHSIEQKPCLVLFYEGVSDEQKQEFKQILLPFANQHARDKAKTANGPSFLFFTVEEQCNLGNRLRQMLGLGDVSATPHLVLLNLPMGGYFKADGEINESAIETILVSAQANSLPLTNL